MRRVLSSLLLGVLVWSFLAPLALALTTNAPASCCRRNGKHHCISGMSVVASDAQQPAVRTIPSCPYRSQIATPSVVGRLETSRATTHISLSAILVLQADFLVAGSCSHSRIPQRGPPSDYSLYI